MDYDSFCKRCQHYSFDLRQGIICSLTNSKPSFGNECSDFVIDPQKENAVPAIEKKPIDKPIDIMKTEIRNWGIGLIILGIIHIILSGFLDPIWGILIVILGIINIAIMKRVMFIFNGIALFLVGVSNIISAIITEGSHLWFIFGIMQLGWGFKEIKKYYEFSNINESSPSNS